MECMEEGLIHRVQNTREKSPWLRLAPNQLIKSSSLTLGLSLTFVSTDLRSMVGICLLPIRRRRRH